VAGIGKKETKHSYEGVRPRAAQSGFCAGQDLHFIYR
jgi:hypothetical protein